MFRECAARNRQIVVSESMELVNPPDGFAAMFPDGKPVQTDVGFGSLSSTHCNFGSGMRQYQIAVLSCLAGLMIASRYRQSGNPVRRISCGGFLQTSRARPEEWLITTMRQSPPLRPRLVGLLRYSGLRMTIR